METGMGFIVLAIASFAYFLPWIVAAKRGHHNCGAIGVLNLLTGWTFVGWVISIVWASTQVHHAPKLEVSTQGNLFD